MSRRVVGDDLFPSVAGALGGNGVHAHKKKAPFLAL